MNGGVTTTITAHLNGLLEDTDPNGQIKSDSGICTPNNNTPQMTLITKDNNRYIFCAGTVSGTVGNAPEIRCSGEYVIIEKISGKYYYNSVSTTNDSDMGYTNKYTGNYFINVDGITSNGPNPDYCPVHTPETCTRNDTNWTCSSPISTSGGWLVDLSK